MMNIELIPSAKRLIRSLRDIGYEFTDAVADIVDNSVEAEATVIKIILQFDGEDSYLVIADNGLGMAPKEIQEALRFGSNRNYDDSDDLGRYGLGLKTASLSQCERVTVSARRGEERVRINSYCWDLGHIESTNRWEILKIESEDLREEVREHLKETTGTVVTWERLGRLLGYKYPSGEYARKQAALMVESLNIHLGMVFHRFLAGEVAGKRIAIYLNDTRVIPWDPYSRGEKHTQKLDQIFVPLDFEGQIHGVRIQPYILPPQALYSSPKAHVNASGPGKWNRQQGLYIYRSNRIIQAGGWSGLRTSDEHTKLARIALFIPSQLDELFQVNVAKKHATLPRELRTILLEKFLPITQRAQEVYRERSLDSEPFVIKSIDLLPNSAHVQYYAGLEALSPSSKVVTQLLSKEDSPSHKTEWLGLAEAVATSAKVKSEKQKVIEMVETLFSKASEVERDMLKVLLQRYLATKHT
jgi:hypothetical protein